MRQSDETVKNFVELNNEYSPYLAAERLYQGNDGVLEVCSRGYGALCHLHPRLGALGPHRTDEGVLTETWGQCSRNGS